MKERWKIFIDDIIFRNIEKGRCFRALSQSYYHTSVTRKGTRYQKDRTKRPFIVRIISKHKGVGIIFTGSMHWPVGYTFYLGYENKISLKSLRMINRLSKLTHTNTHTHIHTHLEGKRQESSTAGCASGQDVHVVDLCLQWSSFCNFEVLQITQGHDTTGFLDVVYDLFSHLTSEENEIEDFTKIVFYPSFLFSFIFHFTYTAKYVCLEICFRKYVSC